MSLFGLLNYEDYILQTVATSSFARNGLTILLMYLVTTIIRFHVSIVICFIFSGTIFTDYIFPIIVNVFLSLVSGHMYQYTATHRDYYASLSNYFITNYSKENFIIWKRIGLLLIFTYVLLVTLLVTINNSLILLSTIQSLLSFMICDLIEHRDRLRVLFSNWWYIPQVTKFIKEFSIIDGYIKQPEASLEVRTIDPLTTLEPVESIKNLKPSSMIRFSPIIPIKPPTPPRAVIKDSISNNTLNILNKPPTPTRKMVPSITMPEPPIRVHVKEMFKEMSKEMFKEMSKEMSKEIIKDPGIEIRTRHRRTHSM